MHGVKGIVDVEHDATRHLAEALAVVIDQGAAHAQQRVPVRQVLGARNSRLRTQIAMVGQPVHRQLEQRIGPQVIGVVAVLVAGGDHQHAKADDLIEPMHDALGRPRVMDAGGEPLGDPQALLDLAQHQQPPIGGHHRAVEARLNRTPKDRRQAGQNRSSFVIGGHGASRSVRIGFDTQILHPNQRLVHVPANPHAFLRLGVPPAIIGDLTHGTFTNSETAGRWFGQFCLRPYAVAIEQEIARTLLPADGSVQLELDMASLQRGSELEQWQSWQIALQNGVLTPNEVRNLAGWQALPAAPDPPEPTMS